MTESIQRWASHLVGTFGIWQHLELINFLPNSVYVCVCLCVWECVWESKFVFDGFGLELRHACLPDSGNKSSRDRNTCCFDIWWAKLL